MLIAPLPALLAVVSHDELIYLGMSRELWNSTSLSFYTYISLHNFVRLVLSFLVVSFCASSAFFFCTHSHTPVLCSVYLEHKAELNWLHAILNFFCLHSPFPLLLRATLFFFSLDSLPQYSLVHVHFMPFFLCTFIISSEFIDIMLSGALFFSFLFIQKKS